MGAFAENLGANLGIPNRVGLRAEVDAPLFGAIQGFTAAEVAADDFTGTWKPDTRILAGVRMSF